MMSTDRFHGISLPVISITFGFKEPEKNETEQTGMNK